MIPRPQDLPADLGDVPAQLLEIEAERVALSRRRALLSERVERARLALQACSDVQLHDEAAASVADDIVEEIRAAAQVRRRR